MTYYVSSGTLNLTKPKPKPNLVSPCTVLITVLTCRSTYLCLHHHRHHLPHHHHDEHHEWPKLFVAFPRQCAASTRSWSPKLIAVYRVHDQIDFGLPLGNFHSFGRPCASDDEKDDHDDHVHGHGHKSCELSLDVKKYADIWV